MNRSLNARMDGINRALERSPIHWQKILTDGGLRPVKNKQS